MKFKSCADSTQAEWQAEVEVTSVLNEAGGTKNALMYPQPLHLDENEETPRRELEKFELLTTCFPELWIPNSQIFFNMLPE